MGVGPQQTIGIAPSGVFSVVLLPGLAAPVVRVGALRL